MNRNGPRAAWAGHLAAGLLAAAVLAGCGGQTPPPPRATVLPPPVPSAGALIRFAQLQPPLPLPSPPNIWPMDPPRRTAIQEARRLQTANDRNGAIGVLRTAIRRGGPHPALFKELGLIYAQAGQVEAAAKAMHEAVALDGDDPELLWVLAGTELARGRPDEAVMALRLGLRSPRATDDNPITAELLLQAGLMLERQGCLQAALDCYSRLADDVDRYGRLYAQRDRLRMLVVGPEKLLVRQGKLQLELGRLEQAADLLDRGYRRDRTSVQAGRLLMEVLLIRQEFARAHRLAMGLLDEPSQSGQAYGLVERMCLVEGDPQLPRRIWRARVASQKDDPRLAAAMARAAAALGQPQQAQEILTASRRVSPDDPSLVVEQARLTIRQGQPARALEELAAWAGPDHTAAQLTDVLERIGPELFDQAALEALAGADAGAPHAAARHLVAGQLAALKDQPDLAGGQLERAIDLQPQWSPPYQALVELHLRRCRFDLAKAVIERAGVGIGPPEQAQYLTALLEGKLQLQRGLSQEAVSKLQQAARLREDDLDTLKLLARAYDQADQKDKAVQTLLRAIQRIDDAPELFRQVFDLYVLIGQLPAARQVAAELLRQQPGSFEARLMLAEVLLAGGSRTQAKSVLEDLAVEQGDSPEVAVLMVRADLPAGQNLPSRRQYDQAVAGLEDVLGAHGNTVRARRLLATVHARCGQYAQAAQQWERLYWASCSDRDTALAFAAALSRADQDQRAWQVLSALVAQRPEDPQVSVALAEVLQKLGRYDEAVGLLRPLLEATQQTLRNRARLELLGIYEKQGDVAAAQALLDEWIAGDAKEGLANSLKVRKLQLWAKAGQATQAAAYAQEWIALAPAEPLPKLALLGALGTANRLDLAAPLVDQWLEQSSGQSLLMLRAAQVEALGKAGQVDQALAAAAQWIEQSPESLAPRQVAVDMLVAAGHYGQAVALVDGWARQLSAMLAAATQPALPMTQPAPPASQPAGATLPLGATSQPFIAASQPASATSQPAGVSESRPTGAATTGRAPATGAASAPASQPATGPSSAPAMAAAPSAQSLRGALVWCHVVSSRLLVANGKVSAALERLEEYLADDPNNADLLDIHATALGEMGWLDQAREGLEKAASIRPDDPMVANNLAYMYARLGVSLDRAEDLARAALAGHDDQASILDTLGWVLYRRGQLGEAGGLFERALALVADQEEGNAVVHDHAGDTFYRLGWTGRALEHWRRANELAQDAKDAESKDLLKTVDVKIEAVQAGREPVLTEVLDPAGQ